jgi:thiol:disulfide interchange protein DsbD
VNERVAFSSKDVQRRFEKLAIVPLKADWTHRSEETTRALAEFGRNSVPLYVLYGPGDGEAPLILPEILTPKIVLDALDRIENGTTVSQVLDNKQGD